MITIFDNSYEHFVTMKARICFDNKNKALAMQKMFWIEQHIAHTKKKIEKLYTLLLS